MPQVDGVQVNLQQLLDQSGTLYFDDEAQAVQTSSFSLGRAFLGLFSSRIREENARAADLVKQALQQEFEEDMTSVFGNVSKLDVRDLKNIIRGFAAPASLPQGDSALAADFNISVGRGGSVSALARSLSAVRNSISTASPLQSHVADVLCSPHGNGTHQLYPAELFRSPPEGSDVYDVSDVILRMESRLRGALQGVSNPEVRAAALFRLDQAVEIARYCQKLEEDSWNPAFAQSVATERLGLRTAGVSAKIRLDPAHPPTPQMASFASLRGPGSATDAFFDYVEANGGSPRQLRYFGLAQKLDSWNPICRAFKQMLMNARPNGDYFVAGGEEGRELCRSDYDMFARVTPEQWKQVPCNSLSPYRWGLENVPEFQDVQNSSEGNRPPIQASFDKTFHMWCAMQMELFSTLELPGTNPGQGTIRLVRTESEAAISNSRHEGTMTRGPAESSSFGDPVTVYGNIATYQDVPFHRIMGSCLLGACHSREGEAATRSILATDGMREIMIMADGLPVEVGKRVD